MEIGVEACRVDASSQMWLILTNNNKSDTYGPLSLAIDSTSGAITSGTLGGKFKVGSTDFNSMTGTLNSTNGGGGLIDSATGSPEGKPEDWTADGSTIPL